MDVDSLLVESGFRSLPVKHGTYYDVAFGQALGDKARKMGE